jgi:hypothetical protein
MFTHRTDSSEEREKVYELALEHYRGLPEKERKLAMEKLIIDPERIKLVLGIVAGPSKPPTRQKEFPIRNMTEEIIIEDDEENARTSKPVVNAARNVRMVSGTGNNKRSFAEMDAGTHFNDIKFGKLEGEKIGTDKHIIFLEKELVKKENEIQSMKAKIEILEEERSKSGPGVVSALKDMIAILQGIPVKTTGKTNKTPTKSVKPQAKSKQPSDDDEEHDE